jgi:hypothetical protein
VVVDQRRGLCLPIRGTLSESGRVAGRFYLHGFAVRDGALIAIGTLRATVRADQRPVLAVLRSVTLPVVVIRAGAEALRVELGPASVDQGPLELSLRRMRIDIDARDGSGHILRPLLEDVLLRLRHPAALAGPLNDMLDALIS